MRKVVKGVVKGVMTAVKGVGIPVLFLILVAGVLLVLAFPGFLVSEDVAVNALINQGFSNVTVTNRAVAFIVWYGGGEDDVVRFTCEATNPAGQRVTVYVFAGWPFKGATIRHL